MRRILRRYRERIVDITKVNNTTNLPSQHIVVRTPKHNHYTVSPITKCHTKNIPHMIPTSTYPSLQEHTSIPTTTTTLVSKLPIVRNTSPNPSNYSIRVPSLKQLPTNTIATTSTQLEHITKKFRSNTLHSIISTSNLQKSTDHQLDTNTDTINKNVVSDSKQTKKKNRAFLRKHLSRIHLKPIDNTNSTTLQIPINNHLPSNRLPIPLPSLTSPLSQSTVQQQTNLDIHIKFTKIVTNFPAHTTQLSRTPKTFTTSKNNNNTSIPTSTHLQSSNTEIDHMRDNSIELKSNNYQKFDQTLDRVPHTILQNHGVERNTKILPSVSKNKNRNINYQ